MEMASGRRAARTKLFVVFVSLFFTRAAAAGWNPSLCPQSEETADRHAVLLPEGSDRQARVQEILKRVEEGDVPHTTEQMEALFISLLAEAGNLRSDKRLQISGAVDYMIGDSEFLKETLPFLAGLARRLDLLFPQGLPHLSRTNPQNHLRRIQVLALLAASFFGVIPHGQATLLELPMNKLDMFYRGMFARKPKYTALFAYFNAMKSTLGDCWQRMLRESCFTEAQCPSKCTCRTASPDGKASAISPADEIISFYFHTPDSTVFESPSGSKASRDAVNIKNIIKSPKPLSSVQVDLNGDITLADGALQVDFADKFVGGLSMFAHHVAQEELIFALRPELLVIMLFARALRDDEAIVIKGAESFVLYSGYEHTFRVRPAEGIPQGSHWSVHGHVPIDSHGRRDTTVVAIDALELGVNPELQYSLQGMEREILKAALGFQGDPFEDGTPEHRAAVATGKWGCVIFGGDNELKTLLQWIAASYAGRDLHYKAFGDQKLSDMQNTLEEIRKKFPTIKLLYEGIRKCVQKRPSRGPWSLWTALLHLDTE